MSRIIISADSTSDIPKELKEKYNIKLIPYHITLDGVEYLDNIDITPKEIFATYKEKGILPKTAAINSADYADVFKEYLKEADAVIHICLGSALSASYNNCRLAAEEFDNVYAVDSANLSCGISYLITGAAELAEKGMEAGEIVSELNSMKKRIYSSFIINKLDFLHAGGRCSTVAALGANLLKLKPCIEVSNEDGSMHVGKKYRGDLKSTLLKYISEKLDSYDNIDTQRVYIAYTDIEDEMIEEVKAAILSKKNFEEIYASRASCTISCHCGPGTLGILLMTKE